MLSYCTDYLATMPEIAVYINCDTRLAVNLAAFNLGENDEFIFAIKNYDYIDSDYAFIYRARLADIDENGEIIFKIPPETSKQLKPGAFYNFSVLLNAFDLRKETEYKKLTENGVINLKYGAQDLMVETDLTEQGYTAVKARLERTTDDDIFNPSALGNTLTGVTIERAD